VSEFQEVVIPSDFEIRWRSRCPGPKSLIRAQRALRNLRWFDVVRTSGHIAGSKIEHYQVTLSLGFTMEDPS
jgi:hypothetical protein